MPNDNIEDYVEEEEDENAKRLKMSSFPLLPFFPLFEVWILKMASQSFYTPCSITCNSSKYQIPGIYQQKDCQRTASGMVRVWSSGKISGVVISNERR